MTNPKSALLGAVNDWTSARVDGDGWMLSSALTYSDGDSVSMLVEPYQQGWRVSDRGEAVDRLAMWGVDPSSGRARTAADMIRKGAALAPLGSHPSEVATFGPEEDLGTMLLEVAQVAVRIEGLRWLARDTPTRTFEDRLTERIEIAARSRHWKYNRRADMPLRHGRSKHVTASVVGERGTAYVQAVSDADYERSTMACFYLFERSTIDPHQRVAAVAGAHNAFPKALRDDLADVATVVDFTDPTGLEIALEQITGSVPAL